jgi:hypothetical protein
MNDFVRKRMRGIAIFTLLAMPFYIFCFFQHICMAGHMHHPPYPWWDYMNDLFWIILFSVVIVLSRKVGAKRRLLFFFGSIYLTLSRIVLGSLGGDIIFEPTIIIFLVIYSVLYLAKPKRYILEDTTGGKGDIEFVKPEDIPNLRWTVEEE